MTGNDCDVKTHGPRTHLCIFMCHSSFITRCKSQIVPSRPVRDTFITFRTTTSFFTCLTYAHMQIVFKWQLITSYCVYFPLQPTTLSPTDSFPLEQCWEDKVFVGECFYTALISHKNIEND